MIWKTVPFFRGAIAVLFLILVGIITMWLIAPDRRFARERRNEAVQDLMSGPGALNLAAFSVSEIYSSGGSLDNLFHYLSKDPGRRNFSRKRDSKRAKDYLKGNESYIQDYKERFGGNDSPEWVSDFAGNIGLLFYRIHEDVLILTGVPDWLTELTVPVNLSPSLITRLDSALGHFADVWIPPGEVMSTYSVNRREVREYLIKNRQFRKRMLALDKSWMGLVASLYNLSNHAEWRRAVSFDPDLQKKLDELTILVLTVDIYRRGRDLLIEVPDPNRLRGESASPGIQWMPEFSYYKNIPQIIGQTEDVIPTSFFVKVNLAYTFRDNRTQTWLNHRRDWLSDYFVSFFSRTVADDFSPLNQGNIGVMEWKTARLKAEGIHPINKKIALEFPFGRQKNFGLRELALIRVNILVNP